MVCALVNRVAESEESERGLRERMESEFNERGDIAKFMTGIETSENKASGRIESHYPKQKVDPTKARKPRVVRK